MHRIDLELQDLPDDAAPEQRLEVVWRGYEVSTGRLLGRPPVDGERRLVSQWLREQRRTHDGPLFVTARRTLRFDAHETIANKAGQLAQVPCSACETLVGPEGAVPLNLIFPIDVDPWSAQSDARASEIKRAVTAELVERGRYTPWKGGPICLSVVSVVPRARPRMDVDNLVKGLLDSMQGVLYENDRTIQCLTSRRLEYAGEKGSYVIGVRAVRPWSDDVVYDDPVRPRILSGRRVPRPGRVQSE